MPAPVLFDKEKYTWEMSNEEPSFTLTAVLNIIIFTDNNDGALAAFLAKACKSFLDFFDGVVERYDRKSERMGCRFVAKVPDPRYPTRWTIKFVISPMFWLHLLNDSVEAANEFVKRSPPKNDHWSSKFTADKRAIINEWPAFGIPEEASKYKIKEYQLNGQFPNGFTASERAELLKKYPPLREHPEWRIHCPEIHCNTKTKVYTYSKEGPRKEHEKDYTCNRTFSPPMLFRVEEEYFVHARNSKLEKLYPELLLTPREHKTNRDVVTDRLWWRKTFAYLAKVQADAGLMVSAFDAVEANFGAYEDKPDDDAGLIPWGYFIECHAHLHLYISEEFYVFVEKNYKTPPKSWPSLSLLYGRLFPPNTYHKEELADALKFLEPKPLSNLCIRHF